jgi:hypothetical protein
MNLLPRSLFSRLVLVLLGGLLTAQLLSFAVHMHDRGELLAQASGMQSAQRIADIVRLLDTMTPAERIRIVKVLSAPPLTVALDRGPLAAQDATTDAGARAAIFTTLLRRFLGDDRPVTVGMAEGASPSSAYKGGAMQGGAMRGLKAIENNSEWTPPMMRHGGPSGSGPAFVAQLRLQDGTLATFDSRQPQAAVGRGDRSIAGGGALGDKALENPGRRGG